MVALPLFVWMLQVGLALQVRARDRLSQHWLLVVLCALAGTLYSSTLSRDAPLYMTAYDAFAGSGWSDFALESTQIEPLFLVLAKLTSTLGIGYFPLFLAYAFASSSLKLWLMLKLSRDARISMLFYFSYFFLLHDSTQIRASIAIAVLYWAAWDLTSGFKARFFFKVIAAGLLMHVTSLAFLAVYFFRWRHARTALLLTLGGAVLLHLAGFSSLALLDRLQAWMGPEGSIIALKLENYSATMDDYTVVGPFVPLAIVSYVLAAAIYACRKQFSDFESLCFNALLFSFVLFVLLADFPVAQFRLSELFSYGIVFLVPLLFNRGFLRRSTEAVASRAFYVGLCLIVFCYFAYYKAMV